MCVGPVVRGRLPHSKEAPDLRHLSDEPTVDAGYALDGVAVLDLFPWTHHVETVASLTLR